MKWVIYKLTLTQIAGVWVHADCVRECCTYRVVEARLVSPSFRRPSMAMPRFSVLLASSGVSLYSFSNCESGFIVSLVCGGCEVSGRLQTNKKLIDFNLPEFEMCICVNENYTTLTLIKVFLK